MGLAPVEGMCLVESSGGVTAVSCVGRDTGQEQRCGALSAARGDCPHALAGSLGAPHGRCSDHGPRDRPQPGPQPRPRRLLRGGGSGARRLRHGSSHWVRATNRVGRAGRGWEGGPVALGPFLGCIPLGGCFSPSFLFCEMHRPRVMRLTWSEHRRGSSHECEDSFQKHLARLFLQDRPRWVGIGRSGSRTLPPGPAVCLCSGYLPTLGSAPKALEQLCGRARGVLEGSERRGRSGR